MISSPFSSSTTWGPSATTTTGALTGGRPAAVATGTATIDPAAVIRGHGEIHVRLPVEVRAGDVDPGGLAAFDAQREDRTHQGQRSRRDPVEVAARAAVIGVGDPKVRSPSLGTLQVTIGIPGARFERRLSERAPRASRRVRAGSRVEPSDRATTSKTSSWPARASNRKWSTSPGRSIAPTSVAGRVAGPCLRWCVVRLLLRRSRDRRRRRTTGREGRPAA